MSDSIIKTTYEPLDKCRQQFRLLEIAEADDINEPDPVVVTIHTVDLQDSPSFAALSYVWGDPMDTVDIIANGVPHRVTRSLSEALKHVVQHAILHMNKRESEKCERQTFRIWADAICINQEDVEERSHQVGLMGRIYSSASLVIGWLSNEDNGLPLLFSAFDALCQEVEVVHSGNIDALHGVAWMEDHENSLFRLVSIDDIPHKGDSGPLTSALSELCRLPYWQRVWIIQEIALSRDLIYTTPSASMHRSRFERGLRYLLHLASKSWGFGIDSKPNATPKKSELLSAVFWIGILKYHPAGLNFDRITDKQFESLPFPDAESPGDSAYRSASLSLKGFQHDATDARDHVYGLLGLTGLNIIPDYAKTTRQVLLDYARAIIESNRGTGSELCFLDTVPKGLHSAIDNSDLPSWTPSRFSYEFCRADRPCHATRRIFHKYDFLEPRVGGNSLFAGGSRIQRLKRFIEIPGVAQPGRAEGKTWCDVLEEFASGDRTAYHTGCPMPRAVWSTVLCKTHGDADMSPFLVYFQHLTMPGDREKAELALRVKKFPGLWAHLREERGRVRDGTDKEAGLSELIKSPSATVFINWDIMLERIREATELFETEEGYFGMGPKGCTVQDEVCLLKGCASPLLLRPGPGGRYSVVGPCFVLGLMDGEASTLLRDGHCETQIFELV